MLDTVVVLRPGAATVTAGGGRLPGADTTVATVAGRFSPKVLATDIEQITDGMLQQGGYAKVVIPRATDVRSTDRVRVTSARHGTTTLYTIAELVPLGSFSVHRKLIVKEAV